MRALLKQQSLRIRPKGDLNRQLGDIQREGCLNQYPLSQAICLNGETNRKVGTSDLGQSYCYSRVDPTYEQVETRAGVVQGLLTMYAFTVQTAKLCVL